MSAVRMCDRCGSMFSVNEEGWTSFQQKITPNQANSYNQGFKEMDMCRDCVGGGDIVPVLRPRAFEDAIPLAVESAHGHDD